MTHLWCILVPFGVHFTVSRSPCFQCSKTKSRLHTKISTVVSSEAASRNHGAVTRSRCGDGVSVVITVPPSGGVNLTSDPSSVSSLAIISG